MKVSPALHRGDGIPLAEVQGQRRDKRGWLCLSPWAALACSCLFFDPLLEFFQDRLILFFHLRALLLICNHFPMSYQPRKLLFLATVAWR